MLFLAVIEEVPVIERITYNLLYVGAWVSFQRQRWLSMELLVAHTSTNVPSWPTCVCRLHSASVSFSRI